jgi:hypothetical protein
VRQRTLGIATLISALALLVAGASASTTTGSRKNCTTPRGAAVTRADRYTVLYRRILRSTDGERVLYWACLRSSGKRTRLTEATGKLDDAPISNSKFRSSHRFIAYVQTRADHYGSAQLYVYAFDLRSGLRASGVPVSGIAVGGWMLRLDGTRTFGIASLAVSDAGGLAWRAVGQRTPAALSNETITIHDATGTQTVEIAPLGGLHGPTIHGNIVSWIVNGTPKTYALKTRRPTP